MSKKPNEPYLQRNKARRNELRNAIYNFNRRLRRAQSKGQATDILEVSISDIGEKIKDIRGLRKVISTLGKFRAETFKQGDRLDELREQYDRVIGNNPLIKMLQDVDVEGGGGRLPTERDWYIKRIGIEEGSRANYSRLESFVKENRINVDKWKENYIKRVSALIDEYYGYPEIQEMLRDLESKVLGMSELQYLAGQLVFPENLKISYLYPPHGESSYIEDYFNRVLETWNRVMGL